jgi:hypothetical protein
MQQRGNRDVNGGEACEFTLSGRALAIAEWHLPGIL